MDTPSDQSTSDDEAFNAFTQRLAQTPSTAGRTTPQRGSLRGWPTLMVLSLVIGGGAAAASLVAHRYGWGDSLRIAGAAIIGGPFGACLAMAGASLLALRLTNRSMISMADTGTYNDMPSLLVPAIWVAGYGGAVGGSALFAGIAVHLATSSPDRQFLFGPPAIGGAVAAALCALAIGGAAILKAAQAPRKQDQIQER